MGGQGVGQLHLAHVQVGVGQAGHKVPLGDGEKVRIVGGGGVVQVAVHLVQGGGQIVRRRPDGLPAAGLAQQVKEHPDRIDQQLFGQQSQHGAPHGVVLFIADVVELLGSDGGAVPGQGPAQQIVGGDAVVVAGLDHEGQPRLPDPVLIVGQQGLRNAQYAGGGALADALFLPQQRQGAGKFCVQISHLIPESIHFV